MNPHRIFFGVHVKPRNQLPIMRKKRKKITDPTSLNKEKASFLYVAFYMLPKSGKLERIVKHGQSQGFKSISRDPDVFVSTIQYMTHKVINSCYPLLNSSVF